MATINNNAYFLFDFKNTGDKTPNLTNRSTTKGNSKTIPKDKTNKTTKEIYLSAVKRGNKFSPPKLMRTFKLNGRAKIPKIPPAKNKNTEKNIVGITYFFSSYFKAGVTNDHTCQKVTGEDKKMPSTIEIFILMKKASAGPK